MEGTSPRLELVRRVSLSPSLSPLAQHTETHRGSVVPAPAPANTEGAHTQARTARDSPSAAACL